MKNEALKSTTTLKQAREIEPFLNGQIANVPVGDNRYAILDLPDWQRLLAMGAHPVLHLNRNTLGRDYVRCRIDGHSYNVGRLIIENPKSKYCRYRDGNSLNLRQTNLY
jgi:hypothetical protein